MIRYVKWDYDNNEIVEYERVGDCNGCGACCRSLIEFRATSHPTSDDPRDLGASVGMDENGVTTGIWAEVSNDDDRRFFQIISIDHNPKDIPCSALDKDNMCGVHLDKPRICSVWPVIPEQVTPFKDCSYSFVEINRGTISQDKS